MLHDRIGETFEATVVEVSDDGDFGVVSIASPAVESRVRGRLPLGEDVEVRLTSVDLVHGRVQFVPA